MTTQAAPCAAQPSLAASIAATGAVYGLAQAQAGLSHEELARISTVEPAQLAQVIFAFADRLLIQVRPYIEALTEDQRADLALLLAFNRGEVGEPED